MRTSSLDGFSNNSYLNGGGLCSKSNNKKGSAKGKALLQWGDYFGAKSEKAGKQFVKMRRDP